MIYGEILLINKNPENHTQKIEEYQLKEALKMELGKPDNIKDFCDSNNDPAAGPDVDTRVRTLFTLRSRDAIPNYLRMFDKEKKIEDEDTENKFAKYSGKSLAFLEQEKFAWNLIENEKIDLVSSVALPTATEKLFRKNRQVNEEKKKEYHESIEELYGKQNSMKEINPIVDYEVNYVYYESEKSDASDDEKEEKEKILKKQAEISKEVEKSKHLSQFSKKTA